MRILQLYCHHKQALSSIFFLPEQFVAPLVLLIFKVNIKWQLVFLP